MFITLGQNQSCFKPARVHHVNNSSRVECESSADRVEYLYPVTEYLVDKPRCQQSIKVHLSTSPIVDGSIIRQGSRRETLFADLLEDAPTRSLLCHRVPHYQASPDMLNRNYEACKTSPIPIYHSGGQVKAVIYHQRAELAALSKSCISSSHHDDFE